MKNLCDQFLHRSVPRVRAALLWGLLLAQGACTAPPASVPTPPPMLTSSPVATPTLPGISSRTFLFASDREGQGALYARDASGNTLQLTDPRSFAAWEPAPHPTRPWVAFAGRRDGQSEVAVLEGESGAVRWLTTHPADDFSPAWSADGRWLAWVSERGGRPEVWLAEVGAAGALGPPRALRGFEGWRTRDPAWHPDGTLFLATVDPHHIEAIYRYDPATGEREPWSEPSLAASNPAINGAGEVVGIGRVGSPPRRGLYRLAAGGPPQLLWETTEWISHPAWTEDGSTLYFTRWQRDGGGHEVWALPAMGGEPERLTSSPSWEDDAAPWRDGAFRAQVEDALGLEAPAATPVPLRAGLRLGFNVASFDNGYLLHDLGFTWSKGFADWERAEPEPGRYVWTDIDNTVQRAEELGLNLLLRIDRTPAWARPPDTSGSHPPEDMEAYGRFLEVLSRRYGERVAAFELWNEPNLRYEWGGTTSDPARYVAMLRVARPALRAGNPDAPLVVGALAVTGDGPEGMSDLTWMDGFYEELAGEYTLYDAFATHPYGFARPPAAAPEEGPGLRHLEAQRALMERWGDLSPLWLTEVGYPRRTPGWTLGAHEAWVVEDATQARYLVETVEWVSLRYPFVEALFLFNLDFSTVDWYGASEQMRAYAILDGSRHPLPAYSALRARWQRLQK